MHQSPSNFSILFVCLFSWPANREENSSCCTAFSVSLSLSKTSVQSELSGWSVLRHCQQSAVFRIFIKMSRSHTTGNTGLWSSFATTAKKHMHLNLVDTTFQLQTPTALLRPPPPPPPPPTLEAQLSASMNWPGRSRWRGQWAEAAGGAEWGPGWPICSCARWWTSASWMETWTTGMRSRAVWNAITDTLWPPVMLGVGWHIQYWTAIRDALGPPLTLGVGWHIQYWTTITGMRSRAVWNAITDTLWPPVMLGVGWHIQYWTAIRDALGPPLTLGVGWHIQYWTTITDTFGPPLTLGVGWQVQYWTAITDTLGPPLTLGVGWQVQYWTAITDTLGPPLTLGVGWHVQYWTAITDTLGPL